MKITKIVKDAWLKSGITKKEIEDYEKFASRIEIKTAIELENEAIRKKNEKKDREGQSRGS